MKLTRSYIKSHRTKRGAWTRVQIEALGLTWPPRKGWIKKIVGQEITEENKLKFEDGKNITAADRKKLSSKTKNTKLFVICPNCGFQHEA